MDYKNGKSWNYYSTTNWIAHIAFSQQNPDNSWQWEQAKNDHAVFWAQSKNRKNK